MDGFDENTGFLSQHSDGGLTPVKAKSSSSGPPPSTAKGKGLEMSPKESVSASASSGSMAKPIPEIASPVDTKIKAKDSKKKGKG